MFGMPVGPALLVAVGALVAGLLVSWVITLLPTILAEPEASLSPSPSPSPAITPTGVEVPPLQPILRDLDDADRLAGVTTVDFTYQGDGTFSVVPGEGEPSGDAPVRWVSIQVEDGIEVNAAAFGRFVLDVLNDNRGWGSDERMQFVQTDGVADYRIRLASPFTAAAICPDNHVAAIVGPVMEVTPSAGPDAEADVAPYSAPGILAGEDIEAPVDPDANPACALDGDIVISIYDWTAGYSAFGPDRTSARSYILNHQFGHLFGHEEQACAGGRAEVMADQRGELACDANAWPYPDAEVSPPASGQSAEPTSGKVAPPAVSPRP